MVSLMQLSPSLITQWQQHFITAFVEGSGRECHKQGRDKGFLCGSIPHCPIGN